MLTRHYIKFRRYFFSSCVSSEIKGQGEEAAPRNHPEISSQKVADFEYRFPYDSYGGTEHGRGVSSLLGLAPGGLGTCQRARKCQQGEHFVRCCHSTHSLLFRDFREVTRGDQQQFATQTLRVHLLGIEERSPP